MLNYQIIRNSASSEWVVFVHGAGGSRNVWYRQMKSFTEHYNIIMMDLRGHGLSAIRHSKKQKYTFYSLAQDIIEVLDHHNLKQCHFIGLSLGTIIIREIAEINPDYVKSMVMAGAILRLNIKARFMSKIADVVHRYMPYMTLYKLYAYMIMPNKAHKRSRLLFIKNAINISHREFLNWMTLNKGINKTLKLYFVEEPQIPSLYIMGEHDYFFLKQVELMLSKGSRYSSLTIISGAGHVCNIDKGHEFNTISLDFLRSLSQSSYNI